jgi:arylsulfatase A-like enzyme
MSRVLALAAVVALGLASRLNAEPPPNVVFILADDLGVNDLACYGRKEHRTPHLDRLASQGVRLTSAYASCPVCSPTRAALLTGQNPARLHLTTFLPGRPDCPSQKLLHPTIRQSLPAGTPTLASHLKAAGYATGCFGKWHLGGKGSRPTDFGFDTYYAGKANTPPTETEGGKGEFDLTAMAAAFVERNRDNPFFLYLAHNSPHIPYTARPGLVEKNKAALEPVYAAVIESLDAAVGVLLAKLDELSLTGRTVVVFTSDNGGLHVPELTHETVTHNAPYRAGKGYLYEGGIRVPAIVRFPGRLPAGVTTDVPTITTDWLPTLLDLCGRPAVESPDGMTVAPQLAGRAKTVSLRPLYWHLPHYTNQGSRPSGAVRLGKWKLIEHYEDGSAELFDLSADIGETRNLAATEPALVDQLRADLRRWRQDVKAQQNAPNPGFDPGLHRNLYIDVDPSRYSAATATPAEVAKMQQWRKAMDAVVPRKK